VARTEARIFTSIWRDEHFLALPPSAQRLYVFLLSQEDLTYCGVMPLRERRWAPKAAGLTIADLEQDLKALEAATCRFIVLDEETGELLIRSFMRNDEVWKQPNLMKAARSAASQVESEAIREAILAELHRIPAADSSSKLVRDVHAAFVRDLINPSANPSPNPSGNPPSTESGGETAGQEGAPNPSANPSPEGQLETSPDRSPKPTANPSQERGGGYGLKEEVPLTPKLLPTGSAGNPSANPSPNPSSTDELVADWLEHVRKRPPESVIGQVGKHIKAMLNDGIDATDIRAGVATWSRKGLNPSALPSCVNELMNASSDLSPADRREQERLSRAMQRAAARENQ
jgi:hypothetical protein